MSMVRRVFRISVLGGQIFREILRPPPSMFCPLPWIFAPFTKSKTYFAQSPNKFALPEFFLSPPLHVIFLTSLFGLLRGCRYFSGGVKIPFWKEADSPVTPLSMENAFSKLTKRKNLQLIYISLTNSIEFKAFLLPLFNIIKSSKSQKPKILIILIRIRIRWC